MAKKKTKATKVTVEVEESASEKEREKTPPEPEEEVGEPPAAAPDPSQVLAAKEAEIDELRNQLL